MKKVYIFDGNSGEFLEERDAFLSPIDGEPLLPANGTFSPPPDDTTTGMAAVFRDGEWHAVPDLRGKAAYDWSTALIRQITELGEQQNLLPLDDATAEEYRAHPDHFRLSGGTMERLSDGEIAQLESAKKQKIIREIRDNLFIDADWRVARAEDAIRLGLDPDAAADAINSLASYRHYLRDFTKQKDWWDDTPQNYDQWEGTL